MLLGSSRPPLLAGRCDLPRTGGSRRLGMGALELGERIGVPLDLALAVAGTALTLDRTAAGGPRTGAIRGRAVLALAAARGGRRGERQGGRQLTGDLRERTGATYSHRTSRRREISSGRL